MKIDIQDAKARLSELVRAAERGEEVVLTRRNRPVVRLNAVEPTRRGRVVGLWRDRIRLADDFDAPLEDFDAYAP